MGRILRDEDDLLAVLRSSLDVVHPTCNEGVSVRFDTISSTDDEDLH
jgi:hypothetical protein